MNGSVTTNVGKAVLISLALGLGTAQAQTALTPEQLTARISQLIEASNRQKARIDQLRSDLAEVSDIAEDAAREAGTADSSAMVETYQRVEELSAEMSELLGASEKLTFEIEGIKKRQRELYLDIDRRLRNLESKAVSTTQAPVVVPPVEVPQVSQTPATGTEQPAQQQQATTTEQPAVDLQQPAPADMPVISQQTPVTSNSVTQSEEREAYQAAFDTLKEGRYPKAKTELKTFLERFPQSPYAGNAQYWLGEVNYVTRNFQEGITEFSKVLTQYGGSNKVPDAMLKLGYTYYELRQFPQATQMLEELRKLYPKSTAARLAEKRLQRIRREGN